MSEDITKNIEKHLYDGHAGQLPLKRHRRLWLTGILLLVFLPVMVYSNALNSPFVLDDGPVITNNYRIRISEISIESILSSFQGKASRPLPLISFALNYYAGGYNPFGYHVVNITIHALNGILLFLLINTTLNIYGQVPGQSISNKPLPGTWIALLAALLWVSHPVNTQSVTYIVQRMNSLAALFSLLVIICYIKGRRSKSWRQGAIWFAIAIGAWVLALTSKETAAITPFTVLLYEWFFFQNLSWPWIKRSAKYFVVSIVLFGILTFIYTGGDPVGKLSSLQDFAAARFTLTERILTQFRVVTYYLSLFIYPHPSRLNLDYDFPLSYSLVDPLTTLLAAFFLVGLLVISVLTARKHRIVSFGLLWFFLNLAIESTIIPLAIIFEHRTYMSFMGLALLMVQIIDRCLHLPWQKYVVLSLVILTFSVWAYQRNGTWKDPVTLWQDVVSKSPAKARPHNNLGHELYESNKTEEAMGHLKAALKIEPHHPETLNNLGVVHMAQDQISEAIAYLKTALGHHPQNKLALYNLGLALEKQKKPDEALAHFKAALQIDPEFPDALNNIGAILKDQNRIAEAVEYFKAALKGNPNYVEALNNLGAVSLDQGKVAEAMAFFKRALDIDPVNTQTLNSIGAAYQEQHRPEKALEFFRTVLRIDPNDVAALNHLGLAHISEGNISKAKALFEQAVKIDPGDSETHVNIGATYLRLEQLELANLHLQKALSLNPELAKAHSNYGIVLIQLGDFQKGLFHIQNAVDLEPDNESFHTNRSRAQAIGRQIHDHIAALRVALDKDHHNPDLLAELASLYQSIGDSASAIAALLRALEIKPDSDALLNRIGNEYLKNTQYDQALAIFEKHLDLAPNFSLPYYNIARLMARQNRLSEAVAWLKKAIDRGYTNWNQIKSDPDLESIRRTEEYTKLIEKRGK